MPTRPVLAGQHVKRNDFKCLCACAKVETVRAWASAEQLSCSDVKKWALGYFGQRTSTTENDGGTTNIVTQKYIDQQSVLLTWNGPWGELSENPFVLEVWPYLRLIAKARDTMDSSLQRCS